jgi:hypothetical protein
LLAHWLGDGGGGVENEQSFNVHTTVFMWIRRISEIESFISVREFEERLDDETFIVDV